MILVTWLVKLFIHPAPAGRPSEIFDRMGIGPVSSWVILALVTIFYSAAILPLFSDAGRRAAVDEIRGFERDLEHWKF